MRECLVQLLTKRTQAEHNLELVLISLVRDKFLNHIFACKKFWG